MSCRLNFLPRMVVASDLRINISFVAWAATYLTTSMGLDRRHIRAHHMLEKTG